MIKRIGLYSLPEGTDPEKFWKYHTEVHAADVMRFAGSALKKYVVSRVTEIVTGDIRYFAVMETWWESEEAMRDAFEAFRTTKLANGKTVSEDFWSQVENSFNAGVEEFIMKS